MRLDATSLWPCGPRVAFAAVQRDGVLELRDPLGQLARRRRREERGVDVVIERLDILDADFGYRIFRVLGV